MSMRKRLAGVLCVTLLFGGVLGGCAKPDATAEPPPVVEKVAAVGVPVEVVDVAKTNFEKVVVLGGMTSAEATVNVIAKVNGMEQIMSVDAKVGDHVSKGQVLATLNSDVSSIQLDNAQMAYDDALRNQEQNMALFEAGAVSQAQMDQLEMAVRSAANTLAQAELAQNYATVTAPISGTVVSCSADVGSYASAQSPMFVIANVDELEISAGVNELNVGKIKVGQQVDVLVSSASSKSFKGNIKEISKVMDMNTKNYPITISFNNSGGKIMAGMYAEVRLVTERANGVIVVPTQAIINRDGARYVYVEENGQAVEREITTGLNDGNSYVATKGLAIGERLIVKGNQDLVTGQAVVVVNTPKVIDDTGVSEDAKTPAQAADTGDRGDK